MERGARAVLEWANRGAGNMSGDTLSRGSGSPRSGCSRDVHTVSRPGCFGSSAGASRSSSSAASPILISATWGRPEGIVCDRFRIDELRDTRINCPVQARVSRWSEASFDIRSLRAHVKDGPFSVAECSRSLLEASLAVAAVKNDDQGSFPVGQADPE